MRALLNNSYVHGAIRVIEGFEGWLVCFLAEPTVWGSPQDRDQTCASAAIQAAAVTMVDPLCHKGTPILYMFWSLETKKKKKNLVLRTNLPMTNDTLL